MTLVAADTPADRERQAVKLAVGTWSRYVKSLAGQTGALDLDDLRGAAMLGAAQALRRYDPARGVKFSSFAIASIRGALREETRCQDHLSRAYRTKERQARRDSAQEWERELAAEYEQRTGKRWRFETGTAPAWSLPHRSLDELIEVEGDEERDLIRLGDMRAFIADVDVEEEALTRLQGEALWWWVGRLPANERLVVTRYYRDDVTFEVIGQEIDRSESRVHQIHNQAVRRLRTWLAEG